jgi:hypothetical protein
LSTSARNGFSSNSLELKNSSIRECAVFFMLTALHYGSIGIKHTNFVGHCNQAPDIYYSLEINIVNISGYHLWCYV